MTTYLVSYAVKNGYGRSFISTDGPVTISKIEEWEKTIAHGNGHNSVAILCVTKLDNPQSQ